MGVPVLSLVGKHHAGRVSASLLWAAGFSYWLADTPESFVSIAQTMAADVTRLARLRGSLRGQLKESSLCDAAGFVHRLEVAMQQVWAKRLEGLPSTA